MGERYPGYDVLNKRHTPSWNEQTRKVVDERLAIDPERYTFCTEDEWLTLKAVCSRIVPQPGRRRRQAPLAAMIDRKLQEGAGDGYRDARLPPAGEAWRRGLRALDAEASARHGCVFHLLLDVERDALLAAVQQGEAHDPAWGDMPPALFFAKRLLHDIVGAYYSHPVAWNEIGFGGPASPRGYVRLALDRRDPWEAAEARSGEERAARRDNARVG
jgi:hypothetical protein